MLELKRMANQSVFDMMPMVVSNLSAFVLNIVCEETKSNSIMIQEHDD